MAPAVTPPCPGDILVVSDSDYRYGIGPIIIRVYEVIGTVEYHGESWWSLTGDVANGTPANHGGFLDRHVYVRQGALPSARAASVDESPAY